VIRAHYDAFKGLLTADPNPLTVGDAESANLQAGGHVVLYPSNGDRIQIDMADDNPMKSWIIQSTCNGDSLDQANLILEKVEARVEGVRPVVAGRTCTRIKKIISRPAERDDDAQPARFYAIAVWRWDSTPA
jgi:hypothetical protein